MPSTSAARFVDDLRGDKGVDFAHQFLLAALELSASDTSTDANKFCAPWSDRSQAMYDDFWDRVYAQAKTALKRIADQKEAAPPAVVSGSEPIDAKSVNPKAAAAALSPAASTSQSSTSQSSSSQSSSSQSSSSSSASSSAAASSESPFRVLIVFDEANVLAEKKSSWVREENQPSAFINLFRVLRRALWTLKGALGHYAALPIFMDTASHLSKFSPPLVEDDSNRGKDNSSSARISVYPPFSSIGSRPDDFVSDWSASAERADQHGISVDSTSTGSASRAVSSGNSNASKSVGNALARVPVPAVAEPHEYPLLRGRPLWRAHFESKIAILEASLKRAVAPFEIQAIWVDLVQFAIMKLRGGNEVLPICSSEFDSNPGVSASIGGCLLNLDIQPGSRLAARLAKSHMVRDDDTHFGTSAVTLWARVVSHLFCSYSRAFAHSHFVCFHTLSLLFHVDDNDTSFVLFITAGYRVAHFE